MANISLASFPNSRVKPRAATSEAKVWRKVIASTANSPGDDPGDGSTVTAEGNTMLLGADPDRTYMMLQNLSETDKIVYAYSDLTDMETRTVQEGGFVLLPGANAVLENKGTLYAKSTTANNIEVNLDVGRG